MEVREEENSRNLDSSRGREPNCRGGAVPAAICGRPVFWCRRLPPAAT